MDRVLRGIGVLAVALTLSLALGWGLGIGLGDRSAVSADGASSGNLIAVPTSEGNRLYLIDTNAKVILVYDSRGGRSGFSLVGGRTFEFDLEFVKKSEIKFNQNGYSILEVDKELKKRLRAQRRR